MYNTGNHDIIISLYTNHIKLRSDSLSQLGVINIYNIKMVSKLLDLPTVTIRAWENRYHVIQPLRDENGHRMYSDQNVEDLRWLLHQTKHNGLTIKHAANLLEQKRKDAAAEAIEPLQPITSQLPTENNLKALLYNSLLEIHPSETNRVVDIAFSMFDFNYVVHRILIPTLVRIGDEWEEGLISVAQEHYSTELIKQRLLQFFRIFPSHKQYPKMIAACPTNERHELGLLCFSLFLRRKGVEIIYLGADTPPEGIIDMQKFKQIDHVILSSRDIKKQSLHLSYMEQIAQANPNTTFLIGGQSFKTLPDTSLNIERMEDDIDRWEQWFNSYFA